jgi:adenylosuccinate synthase
VHPTALLVEAEALGRIGVTDALARLMIDGECRITTPFHQAAGRLREHLRGAAAHGTCGVGVGETVRHALQHPEQGLRYADLQRLDPPRLSTQLQTIRETFRAEFLPQCSEGITDAVSSELQILEDETVAAKWMASARALARHCPPAAFEQICGQLQPEGCVLFEGAQGVLLDEWRGFHPHTTWSSINTAAVEGVAARFGIEVPIEHYGALRTYLTRHGAGPMPTHDGSLDDLLPEPHNGGAGWQGEFRRGHPDAVLLRYALEAVGPLSGLLISHLDIFQRGVSLKWYKGYSVTSPLLQWARYVEQLAFEASVDLNRQLALTELLKNAQPEYVTKPIDSVLIFLDRISEVTSLPVAGCSYGPACADVLVP